MPKRLLWSLLALTIGLPAAADEMLVFKKESLYKGGAMRVASYQRKGGQLLITGLHGELFAAAESAVDWERSARATEALRGSMSSDEARRLEEERIHRNAVARQEKPPLGLVEASRRYGVDKPAVSVASGSAVRDVELPRAEGEKSAPAPGAAGAESTEVKAAKDRLAAAKAEYDKIAKEIERLRADTNTDPLSSTQRETRLREQQTLLADVQKKVQSGEEAVNRAVADAARKAEKPAEKPAGTPAPAKPPAPAAGAR